MAKKHGNNVYLDGKFRMDKVGKFRDGSLFRPIVNFRVCTDDEKYGGHHHVTAYDRLAEEIAATSQAFTILTESGRVIPDPIGGGQMEISIRGWLRTMCDGTVVVVEFARFHTYEVVRKYANVLLAKKEVVFPEISASS